MTVTNAQNEPLIEFNDQDPARLSDLPDDHPLVAAIRDIASTVLPTDVATAVTQAAQLANQTLEQAAQQASISATLNQQSSAIIATAQQVNTDSISHAADAAGSAQASGTSAANAHTSELNASTSAGTATTQAGVATDQATVSTTQAGIATTQAGIATTQATSSTTQAGIATTQAGIATSASLAAGAYPNSAATTVPSTVASGATYWAASADGSYLQLYKNNAGVPLSLGVSAPLKPLVDAVMAYLQSTDNTAAIALTDQSGWIALLLGAAGITASTYKLAGSGVSGTDGTGKTFSLAPSLLALNSGFSLGDFDLPGFYFSDAQGFLTLGMAGSAGSTNVLQAPSRALNLQSGFSISDFELPGFYIADQAGFISLCISGATGAVSPLGSSTSSSGSGGTTTPTTPTTTSQTPLGALRAALYDEMRDVNIACLGDSITWGMTTANQAPQDPRGHALSDVRNYILPDTTVTPNRPIPASWFNLLHQYLGNRFSRGTLSSPSAGIALYTALHMIDVANDPRISVINTSTNAAVTKVVTLNASALLVQCCDVSNSNALKFRVTGDNFTLCYTAMNNNSGDHFEVFIDGVSQGTVSTYQSSIKYGMTAAYSMTSGVHDVLVVCTGTLTRFEAIRRTRYIRLKNQGLIGTNTSEWLPTGAILPNSITADDAFIFVQLGTNDRASSSPADPAWTKRNLTAIAKYLIGLGRTVTMMAANYATNDYPMVAGFPYSQADVARVVQQVAAENGCSFIDNYEATLRQYLSGTLALADGLHPADASHMAMFTNIAARIETAT